MIQRFLHDVLEEGIQAIKDEPTRLEQLFGDQGWCLNATEVGAIRTWFEQNQIDVFHHYPRRDYAPPYICIVLGDETESDQFIGEDAGMIDEGVDLGTEMKGSVWQPVYNFLVLTDHPDATLYLYEVVRWILLEKHEAFLHHGLTHLQRSGGDLAPDERFIPEHLFARQVQLKTEYALELPVSGSARGKGYRVRGMHIDRVGSPGQDVGDVQTLVTVVPVSGEE